MIRRLLAIFLVLCPVPLAAGQKNYVTSLLGPPRWQLTASSPASLQSLARWGENPAVDKEFGVSSVAERTYQKNSITATAYFEKAADASSAYGLFTFYQDPAMRPEPGVQLAVTGAAGALLSRGLYFIRVLRPSSSELSDQDFRDLLTTIAGPHISAQNAESLPAPLPIPGIVPGTQKYILGPAAAKNVLPSFPVKLIGFEDGVEAQTGIYRAGRERLTLLAISYPTPQIARFRYLAMQSALRINQLHGPGSVYGRQSGSYALMVLDAESPEAARQILDQFHVSQTVTYAPRRRLQASVAHQLVMMILGDFELVLIITVCGVGGGVSAFLCKRLIIRFFPEWATARAENQELIRLKLS